MAPYYASVWALIDEKGIKCVITTRKKAREFFLKKIVAVDGLNQGHNGGRAPVTFAERRTNLGRRVLKLCLLGARPALFLDGRYASPGAGKTKQHAARARRPPLFTVPSQDDDAYYARRSRLCDRDALGDDFRDHRVQLKADAEAFGFPVFMVEDGEAESAPAWCSRAQMIGSVSSPPCVDYVLESDQDAFGYGVNTAIRFMEDRAPPHKRKWTEVIRRVDLLTGLGLATVGSVCALLFLLGVNDIKPPVEAIMPRGATAAAAKRACDDATAANATDADKEKWGDVKETRIAKARETLRFVHRLAAKASSGGLADALAVLIHLAARSDNDLAVCTAEDYNKYVLKFLGRPGTKARRVISKQLHYYEEEMRNGGARAACGAGASPVNLRSFRNRVRATTFPRGILPLGAGGTARSAKDAYRWASNQFGGGLLPPIDSDRGKKILQRFVEIRALSKKGQL